MSDSGCEVRYMPGNSGHSHEYSRLIRFADPLADIQRDLVLIDGFLRVAVESVEVAQPHVHLIEIFEINECPQYAWTMKAKLTSERRMLVSASSCFANVALAS